MRLNERKIGEVVGKIQWRRETKTIYVNEVAFSHVISIPVGHCLIIRDCSVRGGLTFLDGGLMGY